MAQKDLVVKMTINSQDFDSGLKNAKKEMSSFDSSIGNLAKSFGKISIAIKGAESAMNFFKKALTGTEQGADAFSQMMYTADSTTKKFYQTLNGGGASFNFFIDNLENIRKNAEEAYEALDKLGTMKMWTSARISQYGAQIAEDRAIVNNKNSSDKEVREAQERINKNLALMEALSGDLVMQTRIAATAKLREMSGAGKEISDATLEQWVKWFEEGTLQDSAKAYRRMHADYVKGTATQYSPTTGTAAYTYETGNWVFRNKENEAVFDAMNRLATLKEAGGWTDYYNLLKEEATLREALANQVNKAQKTAQKEFKTTGGGNGSNTQAAFTMTEDQIIEYWNRAMQNEILAADREKDAMIIDIELEDEDIVEPELDALIERVKQLNTEWQNHIQNMVLYSDVIGQFSNMFAELTNLAADGSPWQRFGAALGGVLGEISKLMSTYASLIAIESVAESIKAGQGIPFPYNLIAILAAGTALVGIISSIKGSAKDAGSFATGGIVGGNSYTGDHLIAHVNSGEMILNRSQQSWLFGAALAGAANPVIFTIEGSMLRGVLDNYDKTSNL